MCEDGAALPYPPSRTKSLDELNTNVSVCGDGRVNAPFAIPMDANPDAVPDSEVTDELLTTSTPEVNDHPDPPNVKLYVVEARLTVAAHVRSDIAANVDMTKERNIRAHPRPARIGLQLLSSAQRSQLGKTGIRRKLRRMGPPICTYSLMLSEHISGCYRSTRADTQHNFHHKK